MLKAFVTFEQGNRNPYVLGPEEYSAGANQFVHNWTFGGSISATGASRGAFGYQGSGFASSLDLPIRNGDLFDPARGRIGLWVRSANEEQMILSAVGSALALRFRYGPMRLLWDGAVLINSGDSGVSMPVDRTPYFVEVWWDVATSRRGLRASSSATTPGTRLESTASFTTPAMPSALRLEGQYGSNYHDHLLVSDDPHEDLWPLRHMQQWSEYQWGQRTRTRVRRPRRI